MLTREEAVAELDRAGIAHADEDGELEALCPACLHSMTWQDSEATWACATGCTPSRIADELHILSERRGHAEEPAAVASTWEPVDLAAVLDGTHADPPPSLLTRTDGRGLLYLGRLHALSGEPEACKGWITLAGCAQALEAGEKVLYVDFEDGPASVVGRLLALGVDATLIRTRFLYVRPDEPLDDENRARLLDAAEGAAVAVLDGVTEALAMHGLDLASNTDVAKWLELLPRPLARTGAAVLMLDHVVKDKEARGRFAIGAQHKLAGVDVAYSVKVLEPFGRGRDGRVKLTVTKDRPGHVRGFAEDGQVADVRLVSADDGAVTVALYPPGEADVGTFRPTTLMERVSRAVEDEPGIGTNALRRTVKGRAKWTQEALALLIDEGYIERRDGGEGKPAEHHSTRPFRADEDTASDRVPTTSGTRCAVPRPRVPYPEGGRGPGRGAAEPDAAPTASLLDRADRLAADHSDLADLEEAA